MIFFRDDKRVEGCGFSYAGEMLSIGAPRRTRITTRRPVEMEASVPVSSDLNM